MAVLGGIILFVLGVLISYIQKVNDQQYIKMESFRRALQKANTYQGEEGESPGASVEVVQVEDRRQLDIFGSFGKGITQTQSNDASVFWAVPTEGFYSGGAAEGSVPQDIVTAKINDDEQKIEELPREFYIDKQSGEFSEENPGLAFQERKIKLEAPGIMLNLRDSVRKEQLSTDIAGNQITQYSYRDPEGQYRYYSEVPEPAREVRRQVQWFTGEE
jgi:hypothetical protein